MPYSLTSNTLRQNHRLEVFGKGYYVSLFVSVCSRRVYVHVPTVLDSWMTRYSRGISIGMVSLSLVAVVFLTFTHRVCEVVLLLSRRRGRRQEDWEDREDREDSIDDWKRQEDVTETSLGDTLWLMIGLMLQQGNDVSRAIYVNVFFFCNY